VAAVLTLAEATAVVAALTLAVATAVAGVIMAEAEEATTAAAVTTADGATADITAAVDSALDSDTMAPHTMATDMRRTVTVIAARLDTMTGGETGFRTLAALRIPTE
jgi:hypothetical protein